MCLVATGEIKWMQNRRFRMGSSSVRFSSTDSLKILLPSSRLSLFLRLDFLPFFGSSFRYWFFFILEPMKPPQPNLKCLHCKASLMRRLKMDLLGLSAGRQQLVQAGLIAYEKPLYQVLSLEPVGAPRSGPISVGELLRRALGGQP